MFYDNRVLKFSTFNLSNLRYGISTRKFGSITNGQLRKKEKKTINKKNLKLFLDALKIDIDKTVFAEQVHGSKIAIIDSLKNNIIKDADGLVTLKRNIFLGIVTADCVPIVFYDNKKNIVGALHAGYKGLLKGTICNMLYQFNKLGSNVQDIKIGIGPAVGVCCYNVSVERIRMFEDTFNEFKNIYKLRNKEYYLDLSSITIQEFVNNGVKLENIEVSNICTKCNIDKFYSYRGEGTETYGEFVTVIGII